MARRKFYENALDDITRKDDWQPSPVCRHLSGSIYGVSRANFRSVLDFRCIICTRPVYNAFIEGDPLLEYGQFVCGLDNQRSEESRFEDPISRSRKMGGFGILGTTIPTAWKTQRSLSRYDT